MQGPRNKCSWEVLLEHHCDMAFLPVGAVMWLSHNLSGLTWQQRALLVGYGLNEENKVHGEGLTQETQLMPGRAVPMELPRINPKASIAPMENSATMSHDSRFGTYQQPQRCTLGPLMQSAQTPPSCVTHLGWAPLLFCITNVATL